MILNKKKAFIEIIKYLLFQFYIIDYTIILFGL